MVDTFAGKTGLSWLGGHQTPVASAARTASGNSGALADNYGPASRIRTQLNVTTATGTTPTLDVVIEDSVDDGANWNTIGTFTQKTTTGREVINITNPFGDKLRAKWTIGGSNTAATLTTSLAGLNNDLLYTAVTAGASGNNVSIAYVNPGTPNATISVGVVGNAITVNLATDAGSAITSTGATVKTAIDGAPSAAALVTVANAGGNDGTGVVTALAATNLTGGADLAFTFAVDWVLEA